jgi:hypothetical protein
MDLWNYIDYINTNLLLDNKLNESKISLILSIYDIR